MTDRFTDADGTQPTLRGDHPRPGQSADTPSAFAGQVRDDGSTPTLHSHADAAVVFRPGQIIDDQFEVIAEIGHGGMGVVYEVRDRLTRARYALKAMLPSILTDAQAAERFLREANTARQLRHAGIVSVFEVRQARNDALYFTMEYLEGRTLRAILREKKQLSLPETISYLRPLCEALAYAHQFMVHRDISPENVMVLLNGGVKLLDFGIAKAVDPQAITTTTRSAIGKPYYMAPEQRNKAPNIDKRADIFSLGVLFFELLTGDIPMPVGHVTALRPELPPECDTLFSKAVAREPEQRYQDTEALREALDHCLTAHALHEARRNAEMARDTANTPEVRAHAASLQRQADDLLRAAIAAQHQPEQACAKFEQARRLYEKAKTRAAETLQSLHADASNARGAAEQARAHALAPGHPYSPEEYAEDVLELAAHSFRRAEEATDPVEARRLFDESSGHYRDAVHLARVRGELEAEVEHARVNARVALDNLTAEARRYAPDEVAEAERCWTLACNTREDNHTRKEYFNRVTGLCAGALEYAPVRRQQARDKATAALERTKAGRAALTGDAVKYVMPLIREADDCWKRVSSAGDDYEHVCALLEDALAKYDLAKAVMDAAEAANTARAKAHTGTIAKDAASKSRIEEAEAKRAEAARLADNPERALQLFRQAESAYVEAVRLAEQAQQTVRERRGRIAASLVQWAIALTVIGVVFNWAKSGCSNIMEEAERETARPPSVASPAVAVKTENDQAFVRTSADPGEISGFWRRTYEQYNRTHQEYIVARGNRASVVVKTGSGSGNTDTYTGEAFVDASGRTVVEFDARLGKMGTIAFRPGEAEAELSWWRRAYGGDRANLDTSMAIQYVCAANIPLIFWFGVPDWREIASDGVTPRVVRSARSRVPWRAIIVEPEPGHDYGWYFNVYDSLGAVAFSESKPTGWQPGRFEKDWTVPETGPLGLYTAVVTIMDNTTGTTSESTAAVYMDLGDDHYAQAIKDLIAQQGIAGVSVNCQSRVVTLSGTVSSQDAYQTAQYLAQLPPQDGALGIANVKNNLTISY